MRKKIVLFLSVIMLALVCIVPFGCTGNSTNSSSDIQYNTKYLIEYFYNESEDNYDVNWTFYKDGTCFLYYYVSSTSVTIHVEATYYYTYENSNLFCFLKEYEIGDYNTASSLYFPNETYVFGYTKNAIMDLKTGEAYLNINYANNLDFAKLSSSIFSSSKRSSWSYYK